VSTLAAAAGWFRSPRRAAVCAWAVAFVVFCFARGIPLERGIQTVWILLALFAFNVGRPWRSQLRILVDWLPFVALLFLYDYTRGIADKLGMPVHVTQPLAAERFLFHGTVPSVWLQQHFYDPHRVHWYDVVVSLVYFSHFIVVWVFAAVLYVRSRDRWAAWARRILLLSYAGLLTYMIYPAAPPWYASNQDLIPPLDRIAARGWDALGLHSAAALIQNGQAQANLVAAIPSLHAAFTAMLTVFVWPILGRVGRTLMVLYTAAMALSLVYAGEHYVVDALLGYVYVAVVVIGAGWWERRSARRRTAALQVGSEAAGIPGDVGEPASADAEPAAGRP
jgi:membrane-associated phospholipid phosphatase